MSKWVETFQVIGSNNAIYNVGIDTDGNYGCSCPVWKFKRQECKHIRKVKDNIELYASRKDGDGLPAIPGNVGEVTIYPDKVLYPLVPLGWNYTPHLIATIIFDMHRAGADPKYVKDYKDRMLKKATMGTIEKYIRHNGRLVYSKWTKGIGWCELVTVPADMPVKRHEELRDAG